MNLRQQYDNYINSGGKDTIRHFELHGGYDMSISPVLFDIYKPSGLLLTGRLQRMELEGIVQVDLSGVYGEANVGMLERQEMCMLATVIKHTPPDPAMRTYKCCDAVLIRASQLTTLSTPAFISAGIIAAVLVSDSNKEQAPGSNKDGPICMVY